MPASLSPESRGIAFYTVNATAFKILSIKKKTPNIFITRILWSKIA